MYTRIEGTFKQNKIGQIHDHGPAMTAHGSLDPISKKSSSYNQSQQLKTQS
jgi:hypothetical protein